MRNLLLRNGFLTEYKIYLIAVLISLYCLTITKHLKAQTTPTVGVIFKDSLANDGYTLLMPRSSKTNYLINNCGLVVHKWESDIRSAINYLLPNGNLLRAGAKVEILDWDGNVTWSFDVFNDTIRRHHDVEPLPNGNMLMSVWVTRDHHFLASLGRDSSFIQPGSTLWDEAIWEVKPIGSDSGEIVWKWYSSDHTIQDIYPNLANYGVVADHPELINVNFAEGRPEGPSDDLLHFNSLKYDAVLDQILISCHAFSEIFIIDHSTSTGQASGHIGGQANNGGDIIYRWGNPQAYNRGGSEDKLLSGQHDARWIETGPNTGRLLIFNNRIGEAASFVHVLSPVVTGTNYAQNTNKTYLPDSFTATYRPKSDFTSNLMSGAHFVTDTRLITCESLSGRVLEYDIAEDQLMWEYINPITRDSAIAQGMSPEKNIMFRATKYPSNYAAFDNKTLIGDQPLEKDPWDSECFEVIEDTTTLNLFELATNQDFVAYPNPVKNVLNLRFNTLIDNFQITDYTGREVLNQPFVSKRDYSFSFNTQASGVYYIRALIEGEWHVKKVIVIKE
jgi:hypothetical protein